MCINLMLREWKLPRVQEIFSCKTAFLKWIPVPENCKNQEINRIESKVVKTNL